jgi:hypothetical protein
MSVFQEGAFAARMTYKVQGDPLEIHLESSTMDASVAVPTVSPTQVSESFSRLEFTFILDSQYLLR